MNFGETISDNDLDASHCYYNIKRVSIRRWVSNTSQKEQKALKRIQIKWCTWGGHQIGYNL